MKTREYYLGIDLGGTNIAAGLVTPQFQIAAQGSVKTQAPRPAEQLCDDMATLCRSLAEQAGVAWEAITRAGVGTPGIVWDGWVYQAANLSIQQAPLAGLLARRLNLPVCLENDANTAALGEWAAGAGRGCQSMAAITIGTGIGSGIILDGRIHTGFNGASAELGHTILKPGGRPCSCGKRGCFEMYCSATGLAHSTRKAMAEHPGSAMWALCGGDPANAGGSTAFDAMRLGDPPGRAVVEEYLSLLAVGVSNLINLFQPEVLCMGGGVAKEGETLLAPLREQAAALSFAGKDGQRTRILPATLGNNAGIIGAAML